MKIVTVDNVLFKEYYREFQPELHKYFPLHSKSNFNYQSEYFGLNPLKRDISFIYVEKNIPKIMFLGYVDSENSNLSYIGLPSISIEIQNLHYLEKKFLENHLNITLTEGLKINHNLIHKSSSIGFFYNYFLLKNAKINLVYNSTLDLNYDYDYLKMNYRKSYKSLINKYAKIFKIIVLDSKSNDKKLFASLKNLHFKESGRKTRSDKTWDIQYEMINQGNAVVFLIEYNSEIISGAYFIKNDLTCYYGVSASDKLLKKKFPLSHIIIDSSVKYFKSSGIHILNLGEFIPFSTDPKILNISRFKEGFSDNKSFYLNFKTII